ncbi:hypothetical protein GJ496_010507 [Pomphorhynchus laevis]|nr:hypothetical protein GJ496_010507 [Pomphorhynchus laevis]
MSRITKQKYVYKEILEQLPNPTEENYIVKVLGNRGNYLYEVQTCNDEKFLVTMPVKYRKTAYICRGRFIMVKNIEEGKKVKAEITNILMEEDIRYIHSNGQWPKQFEDNPYLKKTNEDPNTMVPDNMLPSSGSSSEIENSENDGDDECDEDDSDEEYDGIKNENNRVNEDDDNMTI